MKVLRSLALKISLLGGFLSLFALSGCELVTDFDRSKILNDFRDGGSDSGKDASGRDGKMPDAADAHIDTSTVDSNRDDGIGADTSVSSECTDADDCPEQTDQCVEPICVDGQCSTRNVAQGTACDQNDGDVCDGEGSCVEATCIDGILTGNETDIDCGGGSCSPCENDEACILARDCQSGFCQGGLDPDDDGGVPDEPPGVCAACSDHDDCAAVDDTWCDTTQNDGTCIAKKSNGEGCSEDEQCLSDSCKQDHDGDGSWCAIQNNCVHNGVSYSDGSYSAGCYDQNNRALCNEGTWQEVSCGSVPAVDSDSGDSDHTTPGKVTVYSACSDGECGTTEWTDYCDGGTLYEYGADGTGYTGPVAFDCLSLEDRYCAVDSLQLDVWSCYQSGGEPGRCVDETDTEVSNCATLASADSDDGPADYTTAGTVTDYTGCSGGECTSTSYDDSCSGQNLTEYGVDGSGYTSTVQDCGTSGCSGVCGSGPNGCTYDSQGCASGACYASLDADLDDSQTYCDACLTNSWNIGGETAAAACCGDDGSEYARNCVDDSDNGTCGADTRACCDGNTDCIDNGGVCRSTGACYPFPSLDSYCDSGTWQDPDENESYCTATGCSYDWNVGGEVPNAALCCGDDAGEFVRTCDDSLANGGSCAADDDACCSANTDCVDHNGACQDTGACYLFGATYFSYCDDGAWHDPDESETYCTATNCAYSWILPASGDPECCGDDLENDDFDNPDPTTGATCCYNGTVLTSGTYDDSYTSVLCYDGLLYDCTNQVGDVSRDSNLDDIVGGLTCTDTTPPPYWE